MIWPPAATHTLLHHEPLCLKHTFHYTSILPSDTLTFEKKRRSKHKLYVKKTSPLMIKFLSKSNRSPLQMLLINWGYGVTWGEAHDLSLFLRMRRVLARNALELAEKLMPDVVTLNLPCSNNVLHNQKIIPLSLLEWKTFRALQLISAIDVKAK